MIEKLACKLGRNDEVPNIELAQEISENENQEAVKEIMDGFMGKDKAVANDCIKVLYEIGERKPDLIAPYALEFIQKLNAKNNRIAWGSMTALATIAEQCADQIYDNFDVIKRAYENGSVITIDNCMSVLAGACKKDKKYEEKIFPFLLEHLRTCRPKEVAQHAERIAVCVNDHNKENFRQVLIDRLELVTEAQKKRINKLLKKL